MCFATLVVFSNSRFVEFSSSVELAQSSTEEEMSISQYYYTVSEDFQSLSIYLSFVNTSFCNILMLRH